MDRHRTLIWRFGHCELDRGTRELRRAGAVVELTPKAFQLLALLLENRPQAVSRHDIRDVLWPETVVSDSNLATLVWEVRRAIGDSDDRPLIRTLRGFGYAFAGEVEALPPRKHEPEPASPSDGPAAGGPSRKRWAAIVVAAVSLTGVGALIHVWVQRRDGGARPPIRSLVVLPFSNLAGDPSQQYLVDGVHEELIADLASIPGLRVISRTSAMHYRNTALAAPDIAGELGVDALVEGSVLRAGRRIRITAQLIRGVTDEHVWASRYDRDLEDTLAVLADVARTIADEVAIAVEDSAAQRLSRKGRVDRQALDAYLRGRHSLNRYTVEGARASLEPFHDAIEKDAWFALPRVGTATANYLLGYLGAVPTAEAASRAERAAHEALTLDPGLSEAYTVIGWVRLSFLWDWRAAETAFKKALELRPSDAAARHGLGDLELVLRGDAEASLRGAELARTLDPMSRMWILGVICHHYLARDFDATIAEADAMLRLFPDSREARRFDAAAQWAEGRFQAALEQERSAADPQLGEAIEAGRSAGGPRGAMRAMAEELERRSRSKAVTRSLDIVQLYARSGNADRAFLWLGKACDAREPWLIFLRSWPFLDDLRSDPRFARIVTRVGLPEAPPPRP